MKRGMAGDFRGGRTRHTSGLPVHTSLEQPNKSQRSLSSAGPPPCLRPAITPQAKTQKALSWTLLHPQWAAYPKGNDTPYLTRIWARESSQALVEEGTQDHVRRSQRSRGRWVSHRDRAESL